MDVILGGRWRGRRVLRRRPLRREALRPESIKVAITNRRNILCQSGQKNDGKSDGSVRRRDQHWRPFPRELRKLRCSSSISEDFLAN